MSLRPSILYTRNTVTPGPAGAGKRSAGAASASAAGSAKAFRVKFKFKLRVPQRSIIQLPPVRGRGRTTGSLTRRAGPGIAMANARSQSSLSKSGPVTMTRRRAGGSEMDSDPGPEAFGDSEGRGDSED